jgi:hypothetical protein
MTLNFIANNRLLLGTIFTSLAFSWCSAQDEGQAVAQARITRSKGLYAAGGPALILGKNLGDYLDGFGMEGGFLKRLNKVLSVGPSLSYLSFKYDAFKTYPYYWYRDPSTGTEIVMEYYQTGGDIRLISMGCDFKVNFVPVGDHTTVSIFGIARPFFSSVARDDFSARADFYGDLDGDKLFTDKVQSTNFTAKEIEQLASDSKLSGGVNLGFGAELFPSKQMSLFLQASFCYTLPIRYAATESFLSPSFIFKDSAGVTYYDFNKTLLAPDFPIVNKGFSSLNVRAGMIYNF